LSDSFRVAARYCRSEIKVRRSRFIATVRHTGSVDEAKDLVRAVSKEFHDATHNCYAYRIGFGSDQVFKYSDDGEPSGTAGRPILEAIDKFELVDTCIVVTRYFGGTKLGTGGLSRAYRDAALDVIDKAGFETRYRTSRLRLLFHLRFTNAVLRTLSSEVCDIVDSKYTDAGTIICDIRRSSVERMKQTLVSATNGRIEIEDV
jgi:uncharacterized YigZ family protein